MNWEWPLDRELQHLLTGPSSEQKSPKNRVDVKSTTNQMDLTDI